MLSSLRAWLIERGFLSMLSFGEFVADDGNMLYIKVASHIGSGSFLIR